MAEGGLKGSRSAEGLHKREKPGKLSSDLLNKFESDPSLTCPQPLPVGHGRLSAQSFTSSSEEIVTSQENIKSAKTSVRIKVPDDDKDHLSPSSGDEDILSDDETGRAKDKKKRKSRWKWSPFKKMKKIFRRKKSPTRVKSCEELPTEHYRPTYMVSNLEDDASLRNRTKSEPSLVEAKTESPLATIELHERRNTFENPIQTMQSKPLNEPFGKLLKNLKTQDKSQDSISEEPFMSSDDIGSQPDSVSAGLDWSMISSDSGAEGAVSFENLPSASSLEGLQAAHDRIKVAPKDRRPPSRALANSSSMNLKRNPLKPHRRSKTDPQELSPKSNVGTESTTGLRRTVNSEVINTMIFEDGEINSEPSKDEVVANIKANATEILTKVLESSTVNENKPENNLVTTGEVMECLNQVKDTKNQESTGECVKQFPDHREDDESIIINKENDIIQTKPEVQTEKEESKANKDVCNELCSKKDISRPVLDLSRRSKSLKNFGKTDRSEESPIKSPLQRGFSLNSIKQNGDKTPDLKLENLGKNEKQEKTEIAEQGKSSDFKNSAEVNQANKVESLVSVPASPVKGLDVDKMPNENGKSSGQPAWIELANRRSHRLSQLLNDNKDNQVSLNVNTDLSSDVTMGSNNKGDTSDSSARTKPKIPVKPEGLTNKTTNLNIEKKVFVKSFLDKETKQTNQDKALHQLSTTGSHMPQDKCVVCGRTVFQMEKCNFDSSVLHRQCIKCSVCKRLLTIGNFIVAESKVYCKPHGQAVSVSL